MRRRPHRLRSLAAIPLGAMAVAAVLGQGEAPPWQAVRDGPDPTLRPPRAREASLHRLPLGRWAAISRGPHLLRLELTGELRGPLVDLHIEQRYLLADLAQPEGHMPSPVDTVTERWLTPFLSHLEVTYAGRGWAKLETLRPGVVRMTQAGYPASGERRRVELRLRALAPRGEDGRRRLILGLGPLPVHRLVARLQAPEGATLVRQRPWRWRSQEGPEGRPVFELFQERFQGDAVLELTWSDPEPAAATRPSTAGLLVEGEPVPPGAVLWLPPGACHPEDVGTPAAPEEVAPLLEASAQEFPDPAPRAPALPTLPTTWFSGETMEAQCRARQAKLAASFARIQVPGGAPPRWPEGWDEAVAPPPEGDGRGVLLRPRRARLPLPRRAGEWFPVGPLLPWLTQAGVLDFHPSDPGNVRESLEHFVLLGSGEVACLVHGSHAAPPQGPDGARRSARDQLRALGVTDPALLEAAYDG